MADDQALWELICRRDAKAFDAFYCENAPRLQSFLRHLVGDTQAAEDIMQETFAKMWRRPNGFHPESGTLRSYLYGIARKRAAEWWRKNGKRELHLEDQPAATAIETASAVCEAFSQLPDEQRTLLWLREVEGLSYAELAETLEIPLGTVRSRLFAAREQLRKIWHETSPGRKEAP